MGSLSWLVPPSHTLRHAVTSTRLAPVTSITAESAPMYEEYAPRHAKSVEDPPCHQPLPAPLTSHHHSQPVAVTPPSRWRRISTKWLPWGQWRSICLQDRWSLGIARGRQPRISTMQVHRDIHRLRTCCSLQEVDRSLHVIDT